MLLVWMFCTQKGVRGLFFCLFYVLWLDKVIGKDIEFQNTAQFPNINDFPWQRGNREFRSPQIPIRSVTIKPY